MKWKKALSGAGALAVCSAAAKLLGALYRIPLTNILGAEGIGLYQMVFPLYTVLLTISSGGLNTAVSKVVAAENARGGNGAIKVLKTALVSLLLLGGVASVFLVLFRTRIASLQGNSLAAAAYLGIAPSIVFAAVIASLRGYFQGMGNMLPSGFSQIIEQLVKLAAGLYLAALFMRYGVVAAVFGAVLGVSLSELCAMAVLLAQFGFHYFKKRRKTVVPIRRLMAFEAADLAVAAPVEDRTTREILKILYRIAIPVTLGALIMPLTQVIDSVMVINVLAAGGMGRGAATSLFGLVTGPIGSLINMPIVLTLSLSIALLPKMSVLAAKNNTDTATSAALVGKSLKMTLLLSLPCAAVFAVFARPLVELLYSRGLTEEQLAISALLLRIESLSIIFVGLVQTATAVLQGADKPHRPAINLLYGAVVKVLMTLILLPLLGIAGAAIASVLCYGTTAAIDIIYMLRVVRPRISFFSGIILPVTGAALLPAVSYLCLLALTLLLPRLYAFLISLAVGALFYAAFLLITRTVRLKELFE